MRERSAVLLIVVTGFLAGCVSITLPSQPPASLPEPSLATIPALVCHEAKVTGTLQADPADPQGVWFETNDGQRLEVVWPMGYRARYITLNGRQVLQVLDSKGRPFIGTGGVPSPNHICDAGRPDSVLLMQTDQ